MNSDMDNRGSGGANGVALSLEEAGSLLQDAWMKLRRGETLGRDEEPKSAEVVSDDPDDLASAFLAQQARKRQQENKLPINEWARLIWSHSERIVQVNKQEETVLPMPPQHSKASQDEIINQLYEEFLRAVQDNFEASQRNDNQQ